MRVAITIRCNRCDAIETVETEAWALLETSCGCDGPYRIIERQTLPEEEAPKEEAPKGKPETANSNKDEAPADNAEQSTSGEKKD